MVQSEEKLIKSFFSKKLYSIKHFPSHGLHKPLLFPHHSPGNTALLRRTPLTTNKNSLLDAGSATTAGKGQVTAGIPTIFASVATSTKIRRNTVRSASSSFQIHKQLGNKHDVMYASHAQTTFFPKPRKTPNNDRLDRFRPAAH